MNVPGARWDKVATPSRDEIDADLICLSSHLAVTTKAGAADGMASRVASPTKIAAQPDAAVGTICDRRRGLLGPQTLTRIRVQTCRCISTPPHCTTLSS